MIRLPFGWLWKDVVVIALMTLTAAFVSITEAKSWRDRLVILVTVMAVYLVGRYLANRRGPSQSSASRDGGNNSDP